MRKIKKIRISSNLAVIYGRFSSDSQREESIDAQVRACKKYASEHGLQIVEIYKDSAKSGRTDHRDEFQRMIQDGKDGKFAHVIVHKLDRFSRNVQDATNYILTLRNHDITVHSVIERLEDTPESRFMEVITIGMSAFYSDNLSREIKKGQHETAIKGKFLGGFPPLGYDVCPHTKKYLINDDEARIVRSIFEQYADGVGYNQILNYLNAKGYTTKSYTTKQVSTSVVKPLARAVLTPSCQMKSISVGSSTTRPKNVSSMASVSSPKDPERSGLF